MSAKISAEQILPIVGATRKVIAENRAAVELLGAYIANRSTDNTTEDEELIVAQLRARRDVHIEALAGLGKAADVLEAFSRHPLLVDALSLLRLVQANEKTGSVLHQQLTVAIDAIQCGLAGIPPTRNNEEG